MILSFDQRQTVMNCCKDATLAWKMRERQRARSTRRKIIPITSERGELERPQGKYRDRDGTKQIEKLKQLGIPLRTGQTKQERS